MDNELSAQIGGGDAGAACMAQLRVLAQLQSRLHPQPLPAMAAWFGATRRVGAGDLEEPRASRRRWRNGCGR